MPAVRAMLAFFQLTLPIHNQPFDMELMIKYYLK